MNFFDFHFEFLNFFESFFDFIFDFWISLKFFFDFLKISLRFLENPYWRTFPNHKRKTHSTVNSRKCLSATHRSNHFHPHNYQKIPSDTQLAIRSLIKISIAPCKNILILLASNVYELKEPVSYKMLVKNRILRRKRNKKKLFFLSFSYCLFHTNKANFLKGFFSLLCCAF